MGYMYEADYFIPQLCGAYVFCQSTIIKRLFTRLIDGATKCLKEDETWLYIGPNTKQVYVVPKCQIHKVSFAFI